MASDLEVLISIPAASHSAANHSSVSWLSLFDKANRTTSSAFGRYGISAFCRHCGPIDLCLITVAELIFYWTDFVDLAIIVIQGKVVVRDAVEKLGREKVLSPVSQDKCSSWMIHSLNKTDKLQTVHCPSELSDTVHHFDHTAFSFSYLMF